MPFDTIVVICIVFMMQRGTLNYCVCVFQGSLVSGKYEKNICFGLWMDPCSNPTVLKVYLEQTSDNISFVHTMTANENNGHDETQIPG